MQKTKDIYTYFFSPKFHAGIPTFGHNYNLTNPDNHEINAPANGLGMGGNYTQTPGIVSFYEVCMKTKRDGWTVVRPENAGPYTYYENQWISYEDVETVSVKAKYIRAMRLGGGMIWSLDFDDFTALCGCGFYPLLAALHQDMQSAGGRPLHNCS